jgi:penicillin-binding protein 1A
VYLAGLEAGLEPDSELLDAPIRIGDFAPRNYDGRYRGRVTMTQALAHSLNSAAVRVLEHAGVDRVIRWARRLGITSPLRREAGLALGASEVTLIELVSAYAALANGGEGVFAHGVTEIRDGSGRLLYERSGSGPGRRIPSGMVYGMNRMMEAVMAEGTGRNAAFGHPAGGKTGTTEEHRDAWFLGYTRDYVAGVWMGNDNGAPSRGVTGGGLPARLWRAVMAAGHEGLARRELPGERPGGFWSRIFGDLDIRPAGDDEDRRDRFRHRD